LATLARFSLETLRGPPASPFDRWGDARRGSEKMVTRQFFQAAFTPANTLRVRTSTFEPFLRRYQGFDRFSNLSGALTPSPTSSVKSLISRPVRRIASKVAVSPKVSNSFSALRAARANSCKAGIAATKRSQTNGDQQNRKCEPKQGVNHGIRPISDPEGAVVLGIQYLPVCAWLSR